MKREVTLQAMRASPGLRNTLPDVFISGQIVPTIGMFSLRSLFPVDH